jgi:hypothetical protein
MPQIFTLFRPTRTATRTDYESRTNTRSPFSSPFSLTANHFFIPKFHHSSILWDGCVYFTKPKGVICNSPGLAWVLGGIYVAPSGLRSFLSCHTPGEPGAVSCQGVAPEYPHISDIANPFRVWFGTRFRLPIPWDGCHGFRLLSLCTSFQNGLAANCALKSVKNSCFPSMSLGQDSSTRGHAWSMFPV